MHRINDLLDRTQAFALTIIGFCESLPKDETSRILGRQLLRSGTAVGANYRAAYRAKSKPDFISKMGTVLEEADESGYWIELLAKAQKVNQSRAKPILQEAQRTGCHLHLLNQNSARKCGERSVVNWLERPCIKRFYILNSPFCI